MPFGNYKMVCTEANTWYRVWVFRTRNMRVELLKRKNLRIGASHDYCAEVYFSAYWLDDKYDVSLTNPSWTDYGKADHNLRRNLRILLRQALMNVSYQFYSRRALMSEARHSTKDTSPHDFLDHTSYRVFTRLAYGRHRVTDFITPVSANMMGDWDAPLV